MNPYAIRCLQSLVLDKLRTAIYCMFVPISNKCITPIFITTKQHQTADTYVKTLDGRYIFLKYETSRYPMT